MAEICVFNSLSYLGLHLYVFFLLSMVGRHFHMIMCSYGAEYGNCSFLAFVRAVVYVCIMQPSPVPPLEWLYPVHCMLLSSCHYMSLFHCRDRFLIHLPMQWSWLCSPQWNKADPAPIPGCLHQEIQLPASQQESFHLTGDITCIPWIRTKLQRVHTGGLCRDCFGFRSSYLPSSSAFPWFSPSSIHPSPKSHPWNSIPGWWPPVRCKILICTPSTGMACAANHTKYLNDIAIWNAPSAIPNENY